MDMKRSLTYLMNNDKKNYNLVNLHGIKNFIKEAIPYNTTIEEGFDDNALLLTIKIPWWAWKVPYFARENDIILKRIKKHIARYSCVSVEYRVEFNKPL